MTPIPSRPTGIPELDRLLGIHEHLEDGTKILIRGGPGAGKTTLAVQLLALQLRKARQADATRNCYGLYLSLEQPPHSVVDYLSHAYDSSMGDILVSKDKAIWSNGTLWLQDREGFLKCWGLEKHITEDIQAVVNGPTPLAEQTDQALVAFGSAGLASHIPAIAVETQRKIEVWVLVDSINLMEHLLQVNINRQSNRNLIDTICRTLALSIKNEHGDRVSVIFLFTSEHHSDASLNFGHLAESFLCDIEIALTPEPITGYSHVPLRNLAPSGYNIELHQVPNRNEKTGFLRTAVETRPFCRVTKCRLGMNQSRRCAYSISPGVGVRFNEIFPGDGHILVFAENDRQVSDWEDFLHRDAPYEYPALRFEIFDRSGLQRVFATQRRLANKPSATDLGIATFDTYWIRWNIEMHRRFEVTEFLRRKRANNGGNSIAFNNMACDFDWACFLWGRRSSTSEASASSYKSTASDPMTGVFSRLSERAELAGFPPLTNALLSDWIAEAEPKISRSQGMFQTLSEERLQLFGRKCSPLIRELSERDSMRPKLPPISVPYHTNVSFLVCREDLLSEIKGDEHRALLTSAQEIALKNQERVRKFAERILPKVQQLWPDLWDDYTFEPADLHVQEDTAGNTPLAFAENWERIIAVCHAKQWKFVAETRTFDTFICLFLEIFWGCGGSLQINEAYDVAKPGRTIVRLFHALVLLRSLFQRKILPRGSTNEPTTFGSTYSDSKVKWAFARHWYSTFIDVLTAKADGSFLWSDSNAQLSLRPLPWSVMTSASDKLHEDGTLLPGVSCWGEWHLAVLKGTENTELAADLINNLMSSQKIADRALRCAGLPTVEAFYDVYGDSPIIHLPQRNDIKMLPGLTYKQLREDLFKSARSRTSVFDFRHCMREIHGLLEHIQNDPETRSVKLGDMLFDALVRIRALRDRELLLR